MELLLIRHAIAEERGVGARADDRERSLTVGGAERFRRIARVLAAVWDPPDLVLASPYARTWQTAQILDEVCGWPEPEACPLLEPPCKPAAAIAALIGRADAERVVFVGHEPALHEILSLLLGGSVDGVSLEMKKGGAALVRGDADSLAGNAELVWLLPPRVLLAVETARPPCSDDLNDSWT